MREPRSLTEIRNLGEGARNKPQHVQILTNIRITNDIRKETKLEHKSFLKTKRQCVDKVDWTHTGKNPKSSESVRKI